MIDTLLKMSATGAVVICIVLVLRPCLRRAPKIFSYVLWLIVLFRLLCPVSVALPVSVFNLIPAGNHRSASCAGTSGKPGCDTGEKCRDHRWGIERFKRRGCNRRKLCF